MEMEMERINSSDSEIPEPEIIKQEQFVIDIPIQINTNTQNTQNDVFPNNWIYLYACFMFFPYLGIIIGLLILLMHIIKRSKLSVNDKINFKIFIFCFGFNIFLTILWL